MGTPSEFPSSMGRETKLNRYISTLCIFLILTQVISRVNGRVLLVAIPVSKSDNPEANEDPQIKVDDKGEKIFPFLDLGGSGGISGQIGASLSVGSPTVLDKPHGWHNAILNYLVPATHLSFPFFNLNYFGDEDGLPHENVDCTTEAKAETTTEEPELPFTCDPLMECLEDQLT